MSDIVIRSVLPLMIMKMYGFMTRNYIFICRNGVFPICLCRLSLQGEGDVLFIVIEILFEITDILE